MAPNASPQVKSSQVRRSKCCLLRVLVVVGQIVLVALSSYCLPWMATTEADFYLWKVCLKDRSVPNHNNFTLNQQLCGALDDGIESVPAYFKALQVMSGLLFSLCLLQLNVFCDNCFLDKGRVPAFMAFLSVPLAATVVGVAGEHIPKDEGRLWQGEDLQMGIGFYFIIVSLVISILLAMGHLLYDQYRRREAQKSKDRDEECV
ncbi:uncharacterized protein LOC143294257 [Babylonia areolata]|uniref:uncharacterized protein LOC143294257 n=1 Tax=Babylonia areolata TaxID=304850 RepID=UPI003FD13B32